MRILILSAAHPFKVAGTVAHNLFQSFTKEGHEVEFLASPYFPTTNNNIHSLSKPYDELLMRLHRRALRSLNSVFSLIPRINPQYCVQDYDDTKLKYTTAHILRHINNNPDVILYLFPGNFLNAQNLCELNRATGAPVFWYMVDSAPLTGGCHYAWDCEAYTRGCGSCPAMYSDNPDDQSAINFRFKQKYLHQANIHLICGTSQQYRMAMRSSLFVKNNVHLVMGAVDPTVFCPESKSSARLLLDLSQTEIVLFFGATALGEKRKGMQYLLRALCAFKAAENVDTPQIKLLVAGDGFDVLAERLPFPTSYLGLISNDQLLASVFRAADIFICPSVEDAGPMMVNQALMSGRPVLAFDTGIATDLVHNGFTGYRARVKDTDDLAAGLHQLIHMDDQAKRRYELNCRTFALAHLAPSVQIESLENLFDKARRCMAA